MWWANAGGGDGGEGGAGGKEGGGKEAGKEAGKEQRHNPAEYRPPAYTLHTALPLREKAYIAPVVPLLPTSAAQTPPGLARLAG